MGGGRWDPGAWSSYSDATRASKPTVDHIYKGRTIDADLDPKRIETRESRDSDANPNSTALIVALDVTGSMDSVLDSIARHGLGALVGEIYKRKPFPDPHMMIMGIGDVECDKSPIQATQFEAQVNPLTEQMEKIHLERGGGGNDHESYSLAWLFGALHTSIDCFEKRGKKGYLFTVGDELPTPTLRAVDVNRFVKSDLQENLSARQLLDMAQRKYEVFHVIIEEGGFARYHQDRVRGAWTALLGQRAIPLSDHAKLAEVIVSTIQIVEGANPDKVASSWSGDTSLVVAHAVRGLTAADGARAAGGIARL